MQTMIRLTRLGPGRYHFAGHLVERHASGWRWTKYGDPSSGGEWRRTRREATLDLMAFLGMSVEVR